MTDFAVARHNMVESQIRTNRVTDPALLDALAALPRELFVPAERRGTAYIDEDLRLSGERFMMEPMVLARLLQAAETLGRLAIDNAIVVEGKLADGYPKHGPYDIILVNGAVAEFPPALLDQLAEGGRLVGVRRPGQGPGAAMLMLKRHGAVAGRALFEAATPYLPGLAPRPRFVF